MNVNVYVLALASCLFVGLDSSVAADRHGKPNFILIFADDLGYGDLACYGNTEYKTPHLDRMAGEGVRFTDFYVPMPYCAPSRAAIMTGRYPFRSGVVINPTPDANVHDIGLPDEEVTIAEALKPAGYATICIGKWHLGHTEPFLPRRQGFDEYYGILYSNDMRPVQLVYNEEVVEYPVVQGLLTRKFTERAIRFIEQNEDRPFFLYLPHAMPHKPIAASEDFYTPGTPDDLYADVIRELDWSVGEILAKLKQLGLDEDTLVVFTSDNGPWFGGSTGGLRGMKGRTWDGGIRVPMIARWPGLIPGSRVCKEVCGTIDLFSTFSKLAGAQIPTDRAIDGVDIFPLMTSDAAKSPHEAIYAMHAPSLRLVRSGKWKLHVRTPSRGSGYGLDPKAVGWVYRVPDGLTIIAPFEQYKADAHPGVRTGDEPKDMMLFDLEADPAEQHDVADEYPEVVKRLKDLFDKMDAQVLEFKRPKRPGGPFIKRHRGGKLRFYE